MKEKIRTIVLLLTFLIFCAKSSFAQCPNAVTHTSGNSLINDITVTVSHTNFASAAGYCTVDNSYYLNGIFGSTVPNFTFTFSPPISAATLSFAGLSNVGTAIEEAQIFINGTHSPIYSQGLTNGCEENLAINTSEGNIRGCVGCDLSGWKNTNISGTIYSIKVQQVIISGNTGGFTFGLKICDNALGNLSYNSTAFSFFPNPTKDISTIKFDRTIMNGSISVFNCYGQLVSISTITDSQSIILNRGKLPAGIYFVQIMENNSRVGSTKIIFSDN